MRGPTLALTIAGSTVLSCALSGCFLFGSPAPIHPFVPPGLGSIKNALPFPGDTAGLMEAAARICTPVATREQKVFGYRVAQRALENLSASGSSAERRRTAALTLARCAHLVADWEPDDEKVLAITQSGVDAAIIAGAREKDPRAAYYLGLNLGIHIQHIGPEAIARVGDVIQALKDARADPAQDVGGPLRVLGILYLKAPAWPVGPGDLDNALALLKEASEKYPSHPQNHIFYAEALLENGDRKKAEEEIDTALTLARPSLWGDYAARWQSEIRALQARLRK